MNQQPQTHDVLHWLGRLSNHFQQFQIAPSETTKNALTLVMDEYRKAAAAGLPIPRTVPSVLPEAKTLADWYRRLLDETMAMFRINPSDDRMAALEAQLTGYLDAVRVGRIRP